MDIFTYTIKTIKTLREYDTSSKLTLQEYQFILKQLQKLEKRLSKEFSRPTREEKFAAPGFFRRSVRELDLESIPPRELVRHLISSISYYADRWCYERYFTFKNTLLMLEEALYWKEYKLKNTYKF